MPRIQAASVAEHHLMRRTALIEAAGDLLVREGVDSVTLAAVGAAAGLARSSVYQYFDSSAALLAAVVLATIPRAETSMSAAVEAVDDPEGKVLAWVRAYLAAATDPTHRAISDLGTLGLPAECRQPVAALHAAQAAPLVDALATLGVDAPELTAAFVEAITRAAAGRINAGGQAEPIQRRTVEFIHAALNRPRTANLGHLLSRRPTK